MDAFDRSDILIIFFNYILITELDFDDRHRNVCNRKKANFFLDTDVSEGNSTVDGPYGDATLENFSSFPLFMTS